MSRPLIRASIREGTPHFISLAPAAATDFIYNTNERAVSATRALIISDAPCCRAWCCASSAVGGAQCFGSQAALVGTLLLASRPLGRRGFQVFGTVIVPFLLFDIYACPVKGVLTGAAAGFDAAGNILFMLLCAYCDRQMMLMEKESDSSGAVVQQRATRTQKEKYMMKKI